MLDKMASYLVENVIRSPSSSVWTNPSRRSRDNAMPTLTDYDPTTVDVDAVSGGFQSVVQISARHALHRFSNVVDVTKISKNISAEEFADYVASQTTPFEDSYLNSFHSGRSEANQLELRLSFTPIHISFEEPNRVVIRFSGDLELYDVTQEMHFRGEERERDMPPRDMEEMLGSMRHISLVSGMIRETHYRLLDHLGYIDIILSCDYCNEVDRDSKQIDVYADLTTAIVELDLSGGDLERLFEDHLAALWPTALAELTTRRRVPLIPTVSPLGINSSHLMATEFPDFEAQVFHVSCEGVQAITVALDLAPGRHGTRGDVVHFIGNADFGVISDEYLIDRLFRYKWRIGGFMRRFTITTPIVVERDGREEEASLEGNIDLENLDGADIYLNPDTEEDCLRLQGNGTVTPSRIVLRDGTVITGADIEDVNFGSPEGFRWSLLTSYREARPEETFTAELLAFLESARRDGYRYLSRPFAQGRANAPITYHHIDGVASKVFFLGDLPSVF